MSKHTNNGETLATVATITEAVSRLRLDNLNGYTSREDLVADAWVALADGRAATVADAVRIAYNGNRETRLQQAATVADPEGGSWSTVRFQYLSATVADSDGETITVGEMLADTVADQGEGDGRGGDYTRADLLAAVAATRHAKTVRAHGEANAARGQANGEKGVANDDTILTAVEAVGGRHYGYAAKVVAMLTADGWTTNANAVRVAVHRAIRRTEGGDHSGNGY